MSLCEVVATRNTKLLPMNPAPPVTKMQSRKKASLSSVLGPGEIRKQVLLQGMQGACHSAQAFAQPRYVGSYNTLIRKGNLDCGAFTSPVFRTPGSFKKGNVFHL